MQYLNSRDREEGFTLVELLIVILIIGILSAIAIPAFLNQRKAAANATLQSDLKNAALQIETWTAKGNTQDDYFAMTNNKAATVAQGENAVNNFPAPAILARWNSFEGLPQINLSDGTSMEIPVISETYRLSPTNKMWKRAHESGEICIKATNAGSDYNAILYGTPATDLLDKSLYYDSKAGGVKTMEQLIAIKGDADEISCNGYVNRYLSLNP